MVHALVDAGERVVLLDNLATSFDWAVAQGASLVIGEWEINRAWAWPRHPQSGPAFFALNADLWQSAHSAFDLSRYSRAYLKNAAHVL